MPVFPRHRFKGVYEVFLGIFMSLGKMLLTWLFFQLGKNFVHFPAQNSTRNLMVPSDFVFYECFFEKNVEKQSRTCFVGHPVYVYIGAINSTAALSDYHVHDRHTCKFKKLSTYSMPKFFNIQDTSLKGLMQSLRFTLKHF